jgi:hypothetical protein
MMCSTPNGAILWRLNISFAFCERWKGSVQAQERQAAETAQEVQRSRELAAKTEDEKEEDELQKQRKWDDWKDDHPTGYGNSKLRPCAL